MKQTAIVQKWYSKAVYIEYLSSNSSKPLSPTAQLQVSYDDEDQSQGLSFLALDLESQQIMTIDPDGTIQHYTLRMTA